jgi:hypothetical protein
MENSDFFSNFYIVSDPFSDKSFRGMIINRKNDFADLLRSKITVGKLLIQHCSGGKEPNEIFWNVLFDPICVKKKVIEILDSNNLKGWTKIPASVSDKTGNILYEDYFGLSIFGRVNHLDFLQSDVFMKEMPGGLFPYFRGLRFNIESWDISDIFMERVKYDGRESAQIFVTKRFVDAFKKNKLRNIRFTNFNDYEIPCFDIIQLATGPYKFQLEEKVKKASA